MSEETWECYNCGKQYRGIPPYTEEGEHYCSKCLGYLETESEIVEEDEPVGLMEDELYESRE